MPRKPKSKAVADTKQQTALDLPQTTANTQPSVSEKPLRLINITIKAKYFSEQQSKEIDALLREKFPKKVITYTQGYPSFTPTSFYLVGILSNEDKVNSWRLKLETKYKLVLPNEAFSITEYRNYTK